jgi:hypothetical protein
MPGTRTSALSLRAFGSNKVIKAAIEIPGDSDLGLCRIAILRPTAKLAVKPINWWLRSNFIRDGAVASNAHFCFARVPFRYGPVSI